MLRLAILVVLVAFLLGAACFGQDRNTFGTYERYGSSVSRYSTNPPRLYSGGRYLGELSTNRYRADSISNPYGRYGSRYSPDSVNNPYGRYGVYSTQQIVVYQR